MDLGDHVPWPAHEGRNAAMKSKSASWQGPFLHIKCRQETQSPFPGLPPPRPRKLKVLRVSLPPAPRWTFF